MWWRRAPVYLQSTPLRALVVDTAGHAVRCCARRQKSRRLRPHGARRPGAHGAPRARRDPPGRAGAAAARRPPAPGVPHRGRPGRRGGPVRPGHPRGRAGVRAPCWSARPSSAGTTTWSTAGATRARDAGQAGGPGAARPRHRVVRAGLRRAARRTPLDRERRHGRQRLPAVPGGRACSATSCCAAACSRGCRGRSSYALYPAFLSYGGWGGDAAGDPPEIVMTVLAALLGVGVHVLRALPGLVARQRGRRPAPARCGSRCAPARPGCWCSRASTPRSWWSPCSSPARRSGWPSDPGRGPLGLPRTPPYRRRRLAPADDLRRP